MKDFIQSIASGVVIGLTVAVTLYFVLPYRILRPYGDIPGTFNRFTTSTNTSVSCPSATSTSVLAASGIRNYGLFTNDSANNIYLCYASTCASSTGARLNANGGALELKYDNLYLGPISCVAATATSTLNVISNQTGL